MRWLRLHQQQGIQKEEVYLTQHTAIGTSFISTPLQSALTIDTNPAPTNKSHLIFAQQKQIAQIDLNDKIAWNLFLTTNIRRG